MAELPSGTVTLLFTDIEGSTRLVQRLGDRYPELLGTHRTLLREAFAARGGIELDADGDALFVAFSRAGDAVAAAVAGQRALLAHDWPAQSAVRVRMGVHTGEPTVVGDTYVGYDVHRAARICSSGHGGQVVVSEITRRLAEPDCTDDFVDLGEHRLKDLADPERLYQVSAAGLPAQFPPLRAVDAVRTNLPQSLTSFVGRDDDVGRLEQLVRRHRLVTVTGPGGAGKTRLALRAASELLHHFSAGVWVVRLACLTDPERVGQAIADTIGLGQQGRQPSPIDSIAEYARDKHLLLVLDNFEHLMPAAGAVGELVERCAGLSVLVTSREGLRLRGEQELSVPPMALPPRGPADPGAIAQVESVRLFVERARDVLPTFTVTPENADALAEIAHRLDGLPLAIELAAARVKVLSPASLVARLGDRLGLLTGGSRDLPERQRTLRATIDWSYELLTDAERALLARLSVFVAPVRLETVEAVCGCGGDALEVLAALVDKSLVRRGGGQSQDVSFWMLETVKEFGRERLAELGEEQAVRLAHAEHHRQLAERMGREVFGPRQADWLGRLEDEHDNFQAAIQWSLDAGRPETAAAISEGIHVFWWIRGRYSTGRHWLRRILATDLDDPVQRAWLLIANSRLAAHQAAYDEVEAGLVEAETIGRQHREDAVVAHALSDRIGLGFRNPARRLDVDAAVTEALTIFVQRGDASAQGELLIRRGSLECADGRLTEALESMQQALALMRTAGNGFGRASALNNIGYIRALQGGFADALPYLQESRQVLETVGSKEGLATVADTLALVLVGRGDVDAAITAYEQSLELFQEMCYQPGVATEQVRLGRVLAESGACERATRYLQDGLRSAAGTGAAAVVADAVEAVAALLVRTARAELAAELFAGVRQVRAAEGLDLPPVDAHRLERDEALVAAELDRAALDAAARRGEQRSLEELRETAHEALTATAATLLRQL